MQNVQTKYINLIIYPHFGINKIEMYSYSFDIWYYFNIILVLIE